MKKTIASVVSGSLLLSGAMISFVAARVVDTETDLQVSAQVGTSGEARDNGQQGDRPEPTLYHAESKDSSTTKVGDSRDDNGDNSDERGNATSSMARDRHDDEQATSTDEDSEDTITPEEHRSKVAEFVKSLLEVADREHGGIGDEVRVVARTQGESASTTVDAMDEVDHRSPIMTFLIGSDYKNLGVIRSEVATTQNSIDQLKNLADKTQNAADKAALMTQINILQDSNTKLDAYVQAHEQVFSLFGWFVKLFGSN